MTARLDLKLVWASWRYLFLGWKVWGPAGLMIFALAIPSLWIRLYLISLALGEADRSAITFEEKSRAIYYTLPLDMLWLPLAWCLSAGTMAMALKQIRGTSFDAMEVLSYTRLFPKLLIPGAIASVLWAPFGLLLWGLPGSTWLILALESLFAAPFLFVLPLHIDQKRPLAEAAKLSIRTLAPVYLLAAAFHLWAGVVSTLGIFLALVGFLLSWHIPNLSIAAAFLQTFEPPNPNSD